MIRGVNIMHKIKNKNGITMLVLVAIIMATLVITSTIIISYSNFKTGAKKKAFNHEISVVSNQLKQYSIRNNKLPLEEGIYEINISEYDNSFSSQLAENGEIIKNGKVELYRIDLSEIDIENTNWGKGKKGEVEGYFYSKVTENIYYLPGASIGNKLYFCSSDELKGE